MPLYSSGKTASLPTSPVATIIVPSTKVRADEIIINKNSAINFCISTLLQLSIATTDFAKSVMTVLQENTVVQQAKTKELINLPMLSVPSLEAKDQNSDKPEYKNSVEVQSYQDSNQQIGAQRSFIQQELSSAQQRAQANQKIVNSSFSESLQVIQAACALLEMLEQLTIKANLTRPAG
ncbi:DUF720 domain-containing protein [Chlamydiifrater phoenicopteri]|uniref:DUF720 domain-containing protein n=1 Tax=Chlamydiifrater phoenicopteri TaxID=2681469 RepID=UPI001BCAC9D1|nr:DUF720 domain-containing protein [Chlamydiifrater phoenicopteri]